MQLSGSKFCANMVLMRVIAEKGKIYVRFPDTMGHPFEPFAHLGQFWSACPHMMVLFIQRFKTAKWHKVKYRKKDWELEHHAVASPRSIRITVITPWYHWQAGSFAPTSYSATIYSPLHLLVAWSTIAFVDVICPYLWHRLIRSWSVVVGVSPLIYRLVLLRVSCWLW